MQHRIAHVHTHMYTDAFLHTGTHQNRSLTDGDLVNLEDDNDLAVAKAYCNDKLRLTVSGTFSECTYSRQIRARSL